MFRPDSGVPSHLGHSLSSGGDRPASQVTPGQPHEIGVIERMVKRAMDVTGAIFLLLLLSPMYFAVMLAVRLSMGGPVHFGQVRLGERGRRFRFYKFRSMVHDSDRVLDEFLSRNDGARTEWDTFQKLEKDPRITPVGHFIRKFSLDELPQLWNVLKGDMSLVGPRPCMERQRNLYGRYWSHYCAMRPGITGLWQVSGRNRLPYATRVQMDTEYVEHWSLWLDIKILFRTVAVVITGDGSK